MPKLIIAFQGQQRTAELRDGPNSIGRSSKCTIPVGDPSLSREHCQVVVEGGKARLVDRGSMNGTILNGKRIWDEPLNPGDKITIGQVTIWYEKRPEGAVIPSAKPLPKQVSKADSETARARVEEAPTRAPAPLPAAAAASPDLPSDYSLGKRSGGGGGRFISIAVVVAVLVGLVFLGRALLLRKPNSAGREDDNLVSRNPGFEISDNGRPLSWRLTAGSATVQAAPAQGRNGSAALLIEKTGEAGDVLTECSFGREFALGRSGGVQVSAWTRFESFVGRAGIRIDWLRRKGGAVVARECSSLTDEASDWVRIDAKFAPPHGAGAYRLSLAAAGHAGRVFFDDVTAERLPPGAAPVKHEMGGHTVSLTPAGVVLVATPGRREVADIHLRLTSEKEGTLGQELAQGVSIKNEGGVLSARGRLFSPSALRDVPFQERIFRHEDETRIFYSIQGSDLQQLDRVEIAFMLPRVTQVSNIPSDADATVEKIWFRSDMGDIVIEYEGPLPKVRQERMDGGTWIVQSFPIPGIVGEQTYGIRINDSGRRTNDNPLEAADEDVAAGRPYEAWKRLKQAHPRIRDLKKRKAIEAKMRVLERMERDEWQAAQEKAFHAMISRRFDKRNEAVEGIERYMKHWTDAAHAAKAEGLRQDVAAAVSGKEYGDRPARILERAKRFAERGRRSLARAILEALQARYPSFEIPADVKKAIESEPVEREGS